LPFRGQFIETFGAPSAFGRRAAQSFLNVSLPGQLVEGVVDLGEGPDVSGFILKKIENGNPIGVVPETEDGQKDQFFGARDEVHWRCLRNPSR